MHLVIKRVGYARLGDPSLSQQQIGDPFLSQQQIASISPQVADLVL